jgi:hypothetical protein
LALLGIGLVTVAVGLFLQAVTSVCENGCPSDFVVSLFKLLTWAGVVAASVGGLGLLMRIGRKRRPDR